MLGRCWPRLSHLLIYDGKDDDADDDTVTRMSARTLRLVIGSDAHLRTQRYGRLGVPKGLSFDRIQHMSIFHLRLTILVLSPRRIF